jgi:ATP-dependent DNA helicase RecQ
MLEQARLLRRGFDEGRRMRVELLTAPGDAAERVDDLLRRARLVAESRADRIVAFAESRTCRHAQVARHFGEPFEEPCGACDVCAPRAVGPRTKDVASPLPDDIGRTIVEAVASLTWPLGRQSLAAMLRGSLKAPPSARRSPAYGVLAAASETEIRRWVKALEASGSLVEAVTPDGFRVLTANLGLPPPRVTSAAHADAQPELLDRLRDWRRKRSRTDGVPAFVVFHDATLHELAALQPQTRGELASVKGVGPAKLERYGDDLLAVIAEAS